MGFFANLFKPQITEFQKYGKLRIFGGAKNLGTDLVESSDIAACCPKCAMYRRRIYSLSGRDKRFPKIPVDFDSDCCGLSLYPYIWGVSEPSFSAKNPIKYSNRPFVDDRTAKEKKDYQSILDARAQERQKELDRRTYEKILASMPSDAPKSFAAFRRIKNANSASYVALKKKAVQIGVEI